MGKSIVFRILGILTFPIVANAHFYIIEEQVPRRSSIQQRTMDAVLSQSIAELKIEKKSLSESEEGDLVWKMKEKLWEGLLDYYSHLASRNSTFVDYSEEVMSLEDIREFVSQKLEAVSYKNLPTDSKEGQEIKAAIEIFAELFHAEFQRVRDKVNPEDLVFVKEALEKGSRASYRKALSRLGLLENDSILSSRMQKMEQTLERLEGNMQVSIGGAPSIAVLGNTSKLSLAKIVRTLKKAETMRRRLIRERTRAWPSVLPVSGPPEMEIAPPGLEGEQGGIESMEKGQIRSVSDPNNPDSEIDEMLKKAGMVEPVVFP